MKSGAHIRTKATAALFSLLDTDTRLKIFHYLTWQELAVAAPTSRGFRNDCSHPSMTQNQDRQLTVRFQRNCPSLFRKLVELQNAGKFDGCTRLRIMWRGARLDKPSDDATGGTRGRRMISQVTDLELSYEPSPDDTPDHIQRCRAANEGHECAMWVELAQFLPNLRILRISSHGNLISPSAPYLISHFQKVASRGSDFLGGRYFGALVFRDQSASTHLRGYDMGIGARDIDMDNCVFDLSESSRFNPFTNAPSSAELFEENFDDDDEIDDDEDNRHRQERLHRDGTNRCIFGTYATRLERVSIRNARYYDEVMFDDGVSTPVNVREVPQSALIKFVRRATNLQWFRSDLTVDNVAMLRRERPDVTFVS